MNHTVLAAFVSLALGFNAAPAAAETLDDAIVAAMQTNPSLGAARARLAATRETLPQARAEILPSLTLSASASATAQETRDADGTSAGAEIAPWAGAASATQLLFASGRVAAATRQARAQIRAAEADYVGTALTLIVDAARAYASLIEQRAIVEARQRSVDNLLELRRFANAQFEAGLTTRTDLAQADSRLAQARTAFIQAQGDLAAAEETYRRLVGRPAGALADPSQTPDLPPSLDAALQTAVRASPILISARASEEAAEAGIDLSASGGRPRVTLEASTSLSGESAPASARDASDSVGVRLSIPLLQGGAVLSRTRQSRALRAAAGLDRVDAERQVRQDVTTAFTGLNTARAALQSAQEQVRASELAYRGLTLERQAGLRAQYEVLDQELDLLNARLTLAAAKRQLAVAERQLLAATGVMPLPEGAPQP